MVNGEHCVAAPLPLVNSFRYSLDWIRAGLNAMAGMGAPASNGNRTLAVGVISVRSLVVQGVPIPQFTLRGPHSEIIGVYYIDVM